MNHRIFLCCFFAWAVALSGCREEPIRRYKAPKPQFLGSSQEAPTSEQTTESRMLAAIVVHGEQGWFFKVTGPRDPLAEKLEEFKTFLKSVHFEKDKPVWTLPEGWQQQPGTQLRFATLQIGTDELPLSLSVIPLAGPKEHDEEEYILSNLNRWRGQLNLSPISNNEIEALIERVTLQKGEAILVNIEGTSSSSGGMGRAPFANAPFASQGKSPPPSQPVGPVREAGKLSYETPEGWKENQGTTFSKASFVVKDGEKQIGITVTDLAAAAGDITSNVNRWRGQIQLPGLSEEELKKQIKTLVVDGVDSAYVELFAAETAQPREAILGVITVTGGKAWFLKLKGDADLAEREKQHFEAFVQSIKF